MLSNAFLHIVMVEFSALSLKPIIFFTNSPRDAISLKATISINTVSLGQPETLQM